MAKDNTTETPPALNVFDLYPKSKIGSAQNKLYQLSCIGELLQSIGDSCTLNEGNLNDMGSLIRTLTSKPLDIISELYSAAPEETELSYEMRLRQCDLNGFLGLMRHDIGERIPEMADRGEVETAVREYWSNTVES